MAASRQTTWPILILTGSCSVPDEAACSSLRECWDSARPTPHGVSPLPTGAVGQPSPRLTIWQVDSRSKNRGAFCTSGVTRYSPAPISRSASPTATHAAVALSARDFARHDVSRGTSGPRFSFFVNFSRFCYGKCCLATTDSGTLAASGYQPVQVVISGRRRPPDTPLASRKRGARHRDCEPKGWGW